jgi:chemotaxis protein MotC
VKRLGRTIALGASLSASVFAAGQARAALDTFQMVRSLQLIQDRIAGGDHAALPMQQKILQMIDRKLRESGPRDFADRKNIEALLIYAMSGGNPITVEVAIARLDHDEATRPLTDGVRSYIRGDVKSAMAQLHSIDPRSLTSDLGSFLALIKGSMAGADEPKLALAYLDTARLLAPGTLVEEAALRRSLPLAARLGDTERFLRASNQYVRRFLRSPYATQYADELVEGIVALYASLDLHVIESTIAEMSKEHQRVIYLRLARTAAIEGLRELSDFAAKKAAEFEKVATGATDPRAVLYSNLSEITSENGAEILTRLKSIDRAKLAGPDRQLLDAAILVATGIMTSPDNHAPPPTVATPSRVSQPPAPVPIPAAEAAPPMATDVAAAHPEPASGRMSPSDAPARIEQPASRPAAPALPVAGPASPEKSLPIVDETRRKLEDIDKMLAEAK